MACPLRVLIKKVVGIFSEKGPESKMETHVS